MVEQTAVRTEEERPNEDTARIWYRKLLSRLLSLKAPNHQIIEVTLPADAGGTESQNGCITTTPSHRHSEDGRPPPQSEQPVPKGFISSNGLPTDKHEVSQPILDQTSQQVPAENDRVTQNGDEAHTLQSTHPRREDKGKAIAHVTNDVGSSSIPPAAVTATTANHPHPGNDLNNELYSAQFEQPILKDPKNPHRSPTDRPRASQSSLDYTLQQGPAEDDRTTQDGDEAHTRQCTHPRRKENGKAIATVTNDAGLSSINVPVEIPYSKTFTERLSKVENLYMDKRATIAEAISDRWKNEIQRKLDKDLQDLIKAKFGVKDNILSTTQLYMVGIKYKETLAVKPTIVITCGTMESKRWIAEELGNLKLHYLEDFSCPWRVRYKRKPSSWTASPADENPSIPSGTSGNDILNLQGVYVERNKKPGVSGLKLRFDVLQDGITQHHYATLGGIISINEADLLMTTAHPFLAELDSGNGPLVSNDMEASMSDSDSDSDYQSDADIAEPLNSPRTSLPFDLMAYTRLWASEQWTRVAYSFLGRISLTNAGNAVKLQWPSSSDWALFQIRERSLLSNSQISPRFSSFIPEDRLTPGEVQIMDRVDAVSAGFLTQTTASIHTAKAVMHVREILLSGVLSNGASGAWVIRGSDVCGYVVAATGSGKSCFMVPMYCAFEEIEAAFGAKPKLGVEQIDPSEEEAVGASYDNEMESTSDDHRPAHSTRTSDETRRWANPGSVSATQGSKPPWIPSLTRKGVSILRKGRRPYERLSMLNRKAGSRPAPRIQADSPDPYGIDSTEVADTAIESLPFREVNERFTPNIPKSRQEDKVDNRKAATNWPTKKKARNFFVILTLTFVTSLASTVVAPGVPLIMHEFDVNNVLGAFIVSIFVLGQITGPLLVAPLSNSFGRLFIYHLANLGFIIWSVACALAPNARALLVFRFFAGCAAAGPLTLGRSSVEDMFSAEKIGPTFLNPNATNFLPYRERLRILLSIASMIGPCIGPIFGGYLVQKEGWRWAFWLLAIAGGLMTITALVVMSETIEQANSNGGIRKSRNLLRWFIPRARHCLSISKPFKSLHLTWTVLAPVFYLALMKGYMYILFTTLTPVFTSAYTSTPKWHLISGSGSAGLTFLTTFVGTIVGGLIGYVYYKRRRLYWLHRGNTLSYRWHFLLIGFVLSSLLTSLGLIAFGWTVSVLKEDQIFVPLVASTLAITGTTLGVLTAENSIYCRPMELIAGSIHASNFLGSLAGGVLPLIAQIFYRLPLGLGWTNTIYGIGSLFILERVWYWYRNGISVSGDELSLRSLELEERIMTPDIDGLGGYRGWGAHPNSALLSR